MRQRDANLTALAAIGPRKKRKLDSPGGTAAGAEVGVMSGVCLRCVCVCVSAALRWRLCSEWVFGALALLGLCCDSLRSMKISVCTSNTAADVCVCV